MSINLTMTDVAVQVLKWKVTCKVAGTTGIRTTYIIKE